MISQPREFPEERNDSPRVHNLRSESPENGGLRGKQEDATRPCQTLKDPGLSTERQPERQPTVNQGPKDRTAYWRDYARKNSEKRKAIKAAWRARNKEKVAASKNKKAYRAANPRSGSSSPRKPRVAKPKTVEAKAEAFESLRERFAAYRAQRT